MKETGDNLHKREQVERLIVRNFFTKAEDISIIDYHFGSKEFGYTDILAVTPTGRLVGMNYFINSEQPDLTLILNTFKFVYEMRTNIKNMYTDLDINVALTPKITLFAPTFSEQYRRCMPFINFMDIDLIRYIITEKNGIEQITFNRLTDTPTPKNILSANPDNIELNSLREHLKNIADDISEEEINTFLNFYK